MKLLTNYFARLAAWTVGLFALLFVAGLGGGGTPWSAAALLMGLFLLVSMYLGGENGYELVAARAVGPAYFAAWFIVFVPAVLGLGLGWPTLVAVFAREGEV